jgi:hypothetical protein
VPARKLVGALQERGHAMRAVHAADELARPVRVPKTDRRIAQARQLFDDDVVASAAAPMVSTCRLII